MITRIFINNFKGFVNFEMECGRIVFLMGTNGSGKTSLVEVLHSLAMVIHDGIIEDFFPAESRFRFADVAGQQFGMDVNLGERQFRYQLDIGFEGREEKPVVLREAVSSGDLLLFLFEDGQLHLYDDSGTEKAGLAFDPHRGGLAIAQDSYSSSLTEFRNWASNFLLLRLDPRSVEPVARKGADFLSTDGSNFVAWYESVANADTQTWLEYLRTMQDVVPGLHAINLTPLRGRDKLLEAVFQAGNRVGSFTLSELSEGQVSLIVLYAIVFFCMRRGTTIALDEPDNYLALAEIEPLLYALEDAAEQSRAQLFVISHHPEIYNRWARDPERCRYLERSGVRFEIQTVDWDGHPGLAPAEVVARGWQNA